jgi:hypothetical protein
MTSSAPRRGGGRSNISRHKHEGKRMTSEADLHKLLERLIDESAAVPSLTAAMIADEAMLLADPAVQPKRL